MRFNTIRNNDEYHHHQMAGPQGGLCEAARAGDLGLVKTLLEQGEQINQVEVFDIMNIWVLESSPSSPHCHHYHDILCRAADQ